MREFLALVTPVMVSQHSLITAAQVREVGGHHESARRLVARGIWERLDAALYGPAGVPMYWTRRLMAAVLLAPVGSLVSHRAAATVQAVGGLHEPEPEISIPAGTTFRRKGVVVHESVDLALAGVRVIDGLPVTDPVRLAVDLGSVVSHRRYVQTMREIRYDLGVSKEQLLRAYLRHKVQGRNGCGPLRDWLDRYFHVDGVPESALEQLTLDAIVDAGLPVPVLQFWVVTTTGRYRLDLAYPLLKVAVEVNGRQHKDDPTIAADDVIRLAALRALGWRVLAIDSESFATDLAAVIRELRRIHRSPV